LRFILGCLEEDGLGVAVLARSLFAEFVDRFVPGGGDDPALRAGRQAFCWPLVEGRGEGVLNGLLGDVDVAEGADQDGDGAAVLLAEDTFDLFDQASTPRCVADGLRIGRSVSMWSAPYRCYTNEG
jgi:hypothetical protein